MAVDPVFERHARRLDEVRQACRTRAGFSPFPEAPQKYPDATAAMARGRAAFDAQLGRPFELDLPGSLDAVSTEISPYTQLPLGIAYPRADLDALFAAATDAVAPLRRAGVERRVGACLESIDDLYAAVPELVPAVMHTAGQSAAMACAGSGVNALDRGLEAIAHAYEAMTGIPRHARWERDFGSTRIALEKRYELVPRGVAVCFTCATFATWNALPSMFASLATGNPVIVKPHPGSVLPMALVVRACQQAFARAGLPRSAILLAVDTPDDPIGKRIVRHPATAIVDFTGSAAFGAWVEQHAWPALSFTETAGLNTVVLESCTDLDPVLRSLATTLCLFSAQMCTSPQNLYVPRAGVRESARRVPAGEVIERLGAALADIPRDARRAGNLLAAIQSPATTALVDAIAAAGAEQGRVVLPGAPYDHPEFPRARTRTPLLVEVGPEAADLYREERFGPISFAILVDDADEGLARATRDVREVGGLTAFVYSQDESFLARATDAYATAGAQLTCNLTGPMPLNFAAAYSDYHVTGLNPAGNASLTDPAFVASRFRIAQSRRPALPG